MFESHVVTSVDKMSFNFWFEDFFSNLLSFVYCVTDQPSITRSGRFVLNFKLSVLTFSRSMSCSMSIEQNLCQVKMFQLQSMLNWIKCINQMFNTVCIQEFLYFVSGLDIQLEQSKNYNPVSKNICCSLRWWNSKSHILFFSSRWYKPMA